MRVCIVIGDPRFFFLTLIVWRCCIQHVTVATYTKHIQRHSLSAPFSPPNNNKTIKARHDNFLKKCFARWLNCVCIRRRRHKTLSFHKFLCLGNCDTRTQLVYYIVVCLGGFCCYCTIWLCCWVEYNSLTHRVSSFWNLAYTCWHFGSVCI